MLALANVMRNDDVKAGRELRPVEQYKTLAREQLYLGVARRVGRRV